MEGTARLVRFEPTQVERFSDHSLSGERRIAVNQDREHAGWIAGLVVEPGSTRHTEYDRIDVLQVAWVGSQVDLEVDLILADAPPAPDMILDVSRAELGQHRLYAA